MAALAIQPVEKDLPPVGHVLLLDLRQASASGKQGLELQDEYYKAIGTTYEWMYNTADTHDAVFSAFRKFSQTLPDAPLIGNALDALEQAHHAYFGSHFGGESCRDSAREFLDDPEAYLPDRKSRYALISPRYEEEPDPGKPIRDGLRDVIAETLVSESKKYGSLTAEGARNALATRICTYLTSLPKKQETIDRSRKRSTRLRTSILLPPERSLRLSCRPSS